MCEIAAGGNVGAVMAGMRKKQNGPLSYVRHKVQGADRKVAHPVFDQAEVGERC
jgi:hypothetical protein